MPSPSQLRMAILRHHLWQPILAAVAAASTSSKASVFCKQKIVNPKKRELFTKISLLSNKTNISWNFFALHSTASPPLPYTTIMIIIIIAGGMMILNDDEFVLFISISNVQSVSPLCCSHHLCFYFKQFDFFSLSRF